MVFDPSPRSQWTMISQGAEARVWKLSISYGKNNDDNAICKERFSKKYRHPDLDSQLTKQRCRFEAKILQRCLEKSNIRVPKIFRVDPPSLYMEYLNGLTVKSYLQRFWTTQKEEEKIKAEPKSKQQEQRIVKDESDRRINDYAIYDINDLAKSIGKLVGRLHNIGIIHGDLTTSNMMILEVDDDPNNNEDKKKKLCLIDFGLAKSSLSVEEQAVDLYVLERTLQSTHPDLQGSFFNHVLDEYSSTTMSQNAADQRDNNTKKRKVSQTAIQRLEQVRLRGRKRECFG